MNVSVWERRWGKRVTNHHLAIQIPSINYVSLATINASWLGSWLNLARCACTFLGQKLCFHIQSYTASSSSPCFHSTCILHNLLIESWITERMHGNLKWTENDSKTDTCGKLPCTLAFFFFFFISSMVTAPQVERNGDWSADDNCIPSAKYRV